MCHYALTLYVGAGDPTTSPQIGQQALHQLTPPPQPHLCDFLNSKAMLPQPLPATLGLRAYLQLAIPFTFTQVPSFWQGFGSQGSLKYCGQLWSSMGPVFSTERFCLLGCLWPRLLGRDSSSMAFLELSPKAGDSWPCRRRPLGIVLLAEAGTSVRFRWVRSSGPRPWQ
jgi:hypothetical protein